MSPELLYPRRFGFEDSRPTKESDSYALGMVILEVLSGQEPFACDRVIDVMLKVLDGERPTRSKGVWSTDCLWETLEQCWSSQPARRPTADAILERLDSASLAATINCQQRLITRSFSHGELPSLLEVAFWNWESTHIVQSLQSVPQVFIDILDEARHHSPDPQVVIYLLLFQLSTSN